MEEYTILVITFGIIILALLMLLYFVNILLLRRNKIDFLFESISNYLNDRIHLLIRISNFVEENADNEQKFVDNVEDIRKSLDIIGNDVNKVLIEIKRTDEPIEKFAKMGDIYPNFIKNKIYSNLVNEIQLNQERIIYAVDSYNKEAKKYNEIKNTKINSIICKIFRIKDYEYYN